MAVIQQHSADKTVPNILARNMLVAKPQMTVLVLDAIGDAAAGAGYAVYRWNDSNSTWLLIQKEFNDQTFNFADENKVLSMDSVTTSNIPANGTIWDVYIVTDAINNIIVQPQYTVNLAVVTILPDTPGQYDGKRIYYKYAYGTISQQLGIVLDAKVDKSSRGVANGVATLDSNGKHTSTQVNNLAVISQLLTNYSIGTGDITAADSILSAIGKLAAQGAKYQDIILTLSTPGPLSVLTGTARWYPPKNIILEDVQAFIGVASTGKDITLALNKNGASVFATPVVIAAGTNYNSPVTVPVGVSQMAVTDYLTLDVTQVGSTITGSDLMFRIRYKYL